MLRFGPRSLILLLAAVVTSIALFRLLSNPTAASPLPETVPPLEGIGGPPGPAADPASSAGLPVYSQWTSFTTDDGLPSNKVFAILVDGDRIWAGTDNGLALFQEGRWSIFGVDDGLPHRAVLSLDLSLQTGDLWVGTMGGLARYSAGKFDVYRQLSSGLSNDFVNEVQCDPEESAVWAATAMGLSKLDVDSGSWEVFTHENTPMHEPWTYSVAIEHGVVYVGAWGGGILEFRKAERTWREYRDPDKEMEIDLLPNDGPVHDVTSAVDFGAGILWQASYMGLARYDGRLWNSYYKDDSGLASNFINFVRSSGPEAWLCTDDGLTVTDSVLWATYRQGGNGKGELLLYEGRTLLERRSLDSIFDHNLVLAADFQDDDVWLATHGGVSRGTRTGTWTPGRNRP